MKKYIDDKISIVIPILNEEKNINTVIKKLSLILVDQNYEIIIVDDGSNDRSIEEVLELKKNNTNIQLIQRNTNQGLVQSIKDGLTNITGDIFVVMDGDGQHDPIDLKKMLIKLKNSDLVIGSRNLNKLRSISNFRRLSSMLLNYALKVIMKINVSDPLTGFFAGKSNILNKKFFDLNTSGFKILLDLIYANKDNINLNEVEISFLKRKYGESKLDIKIIFSFITQLLSLILNGKISSKYIGFLLIGSIGMIIHVSLFFLFLSFGYSFLISFITSSFIATLNNFSLNNMINFKKNYKISKFKFFILGFLKYLLITLPGIITSVGAAGIVYINFNNNTLFAISIGILVDVTFKYFLASKWIWK